MRPVVGAALVLTAMACSEQAYVDRDPILRTFKVELTRDSLSGTLAEPLPFPSANPARLSLVITALDKRGATYTGYEGRARISAQPGVFLRGEDRVQFENGLARVDAVFRYSYGETRLWLEDVGEDILTECADGQDNDGDRVSDGDDPDCQAGGLDPAAKSTGATGVTRPLYFARPRIADLQFSPRCTTNTPLGGQNITIETGSLIVTGTTKSGLYVTDLAGAATGYNSVFLFTFSNPGGVVEGDRLCNIAGNAAEFIGNSQLNFPSYLNVDLERQLAIEGQTIVPCKVDDPERTGKDALPEPHVLTADDVAGLDADVPAEFYKQCGPNDTVVPGLKPEEYTDCEKVSQALGRDVVRETDIDCRRDNFRMEPWEHALVAFEDVTLSTHFEVCDINDDGSINRARGNPEGECDKTCSEDALCTVTLSLEQFGQFAAGLGCTDPDEPTSCTGKVYISTRDTLGSSGFDIREHAGEKLRRIVGHLRQTQPGAGVQTIWIVEPRTIDDFDFEPAAAE